MLPAIAVCQFVSRYARIVAFGFVVNRAEQNFVAGLDIDRRQAAGRIGSPADRA